MIRICCTMAKPLPIHWMGHAYKNYIVKFVLFSLVSLTLQLALTESYVFLFAWLSLRIYLLVLHCHASVHIPVLLSDLSSFVYCSGYLIVSPQKIRPDQDFRLFVTIYKMYHHECDVRAVLSRDAVEYATETVTFTHTGTKQMILKVDLIF